MAKPGPKPLEPGAVDVGGAPEGFDAKLLAELVARAGGPVLHVARDDRRAAAMAGSLAVFAPELPVFRFPAWDCLPYDRVSPNAEISAGRMATLALLAQGFDRPAVVLTTVNAAAQRVPARETVRGASFAAAVGERIDLDALLAYLARMGFNRTATVAEPGDFAVRGGIVDVFPPGAAQPVRLDLFGDVLDGARRFEVESQRTTDRVDGVEFAPASEIILDEESVARFRTRYRETFGAAGLDDPLYEAVSAGRKHQGMEHWAPFFHARMDTLFDYLAGAPVTMDAQAEDARDARLETVLDHYEARRAAGDSRAMGAPVYKPCPPELLYLDAAGWATALEGRAVRRFDPNRRPPGPTSIDAGGRIGRSFAQERQQEGVNVFDALADHIEARRAEGPVVLASYSEGARDRLATLLHDHGIEGAATAARWSEIGSKGVRLLVWPLEQGFETATLTVISEQDVLGDRLIRGARRKKRADNFLTEAAALSVGDLVVHVEHGIGRYLGLQTIEAMGAPHECLALEYAGASKLYLRSRTSSCCRAMARARRSSTGWAAAPGRRARPS